MLKWDKDYGGFAPTHTKISTPRTRVIWISIQIGMRFFLFLFFKEERKHNSKKEKSRVFPGSKWPETIVRSF